MGHSFCPGRYSLDFGLAWLLWTCLACSIWPGLFGLAWLVRIGLLFGLAWATRVGLAYSVWPGLFGLAWLLRIGRSYLVWPGIFDLAWLVWVRLACLIWLGLFGLTWPIRSGLACSVWPGLLRCLAGTGTQSFLIRCGVSRFTFVEFCCQNFRICCYWGVHDGPGGPERCKRGSWGRFRDD